MSRTWKPTGQAIPLYCVVRDGEVKLRVPLTTHADGTLWCGENPLLESLPSFGKEQAAAAIRARKFDSIPREAFARIGTSPGGLRVVLAEEWDDEQRPRIVAEVKAREAALEAACPGLRALQAARDEAEEYREKFNRMMDDENNDGVNPPRRPTSDPAALARQFPRGAAYLRAESYSFASHHAKAGAGTRAMARLLAGEDETVVLRDMDREWSDAAERCVMNS